MSSFDDLPAANPDQEPMVRPPINMILFCPDCGLQHVDEPSETWTNPPHRSHLCAGCGHIWRPSNVPTNGVAEITSRGDADHQPPRRGRAGRCVDGCDGPVELG